MDEQYKLKITLAAEKDITSIYDYVASQIEPFHAESLISEMENKMRTLCAFPYKYALSLDEVLAQRGYRRLVIKNYVVLYLIDEDEKQILIARVFYGRMNYPKYV